MLGTGPSVTFEDAADRVRESGKPVESLLDALKTGKLTAQSAVSRVWVLTAHTFRFEEFKAAASKTNAARPNAKTLSSRQPDFSEKVDQQWTGLYVPSGPSEPLTLINIGEIEHGPLGMSRYQSAPYPLILKFELDFILYMPFVIAIDHEIKDEVLSPRFWQRSFKPKRQSFFSDNISTFQRKEAHGITLRAEALDRFIEGREIKKRGPKHIYESAEANAEFKAWLTVNPRCDRRMQAEKLREIYKRHHLRIGEDDSFRAETDAIAVLMGSAKTR